MSHRSQATQRTVELLVPPELDLSALMDAIGRYLPFTRGPDTTLSYRVYDSFDWRLFAAGASIEWCFTEDSVWQHPPSGLLERSAPLRPMLRWRDLHRPDQAPIQQPLESEPGLLEELPEGPVRERLAALLEMRRLLPLVDVISQQTPLRLLNDDQKTVVWLLIEQNRFREPTSGRSGALACRLRLKSVRGYLACFEQARTVLSEQLGLSTLTEPMAQEALTAAGHLPGSYSTKLDQRLDPNQRADLATKQILRGLLETLEANVEGTRQNLDSEFLHDLRVATRRTRAALSQIKGVFPETVVAKHKQGFAWLQQVTGPVRDLDVYLLDFPALEQRVPPMLRDGLKPLHAQLQRQHGQAQRQLARELGSERFHHLLSDWRAFLDAPVPPTQAQAVGLETQADSAVVQSGRNALVEEDQRQQHGPPPPQAALPIKQVADQRIRKMLKRVRAEGRAITQESAPEALHELRKSCKKLRYLMEFFQSLYPKTQIREQIKQTKRLLDNLGRFQDTAVQAQHLCEQAGASTGSPGLPPATLLAMGALISQILSDQADARASFGEVFAEFDSAENAERFKVLLHGLADQRLAPAAMTKNDSVATRASSAEFGGRGEPSSHQPAERRPRSDASPSDTQDRAVRERR